MRHYGTKKTIPKAKETKAHLLAAQQARERKLRADNAGNLDFKMKRFTDIRSKVNLNKYAKSSQLVNLGASLVSNRNG